MLLACGAKTFDIWVTSVESRFTETAIFLSKMWKFREPISDQVPLFLLNNDLIVGHKGGSKQYLEKLKQNEN